VAQPLVKSDPAQTSGIDAAAMRLQQALERLEAAVVSASAEHHSLKAGHEKLNLLLREAEEKSTQLRQVTGTVIKRLNHTIDKLEKMEE
jgi:multidrug resistance efflux pump